METTAKAMGFDGLVTRRAALRWLGGAGAALVAGGMLAGRAGATGGATQFRTTTALNLRATPSMSGKILLVIPSGKLVENLGASSNGYCKVSYKGTIGWAYGAFLQDVVPDPDPDYTIIGEAVTTTAVNFRSGPSTGHQVLRVLPKGTRVSVSDQVSNGYRYVIADGYLFGWVYDDYLSDVDEQGPLTFKTDRDVNLRAEPSKSAAVIRVVPKGAKVTDYDLVMANGYRGVDYKGSVGWIFDDYLFQV